MKALSYPNEELLGIWEEQYYEIAHIVEDFRFARDLLRRLGPEERRRFSAAGWAWGSNTGYGGPPEEIYDAQLPCVLEALGLDLYAGHRAARVLRVANQGLGGPPWQTQA